ncbi:sodium/glutamate symporter [Clostridium sediminicola]|uniref:sodium/glutamate symporter n=1 Tax=Clostridium sediminicola TaxID=3114879 RepID=UPI0031F245E3
MELTMKTAIWNMFLDASIMGGLLLLAQLCRAQIKVLQKLLIPPALIAGFLALAFGPKGLGYLPLSDSIGTYASILIVVVFAATPIGDKPKKEDISGPVMGGMFFNITGICVLEYAVGMLVAVYGLVHLFPDLPKEFGLMMATGFYGGHGTAIAVGNALQNLGVENMTDIGSTFATIGIVGGIIFGMIIINWGARKGYTHYVADPQDLPTELRTGLIPVEKQKAVGKVTISSICIDPMAFHVSLVLLASLMGYYMTKYFKVFTGNLGYKVSIPVFCTALFGGFILNMILNKTGGIKYVDRYTIGRVQGTATDFLMVAGIGSLNLSVVLEYGAPILILSAIGFLTVWFWFMVVGTKSSKHDWFERNMMSWGHATGVVATGVLLSRTVDPDLKSRAIEDTGFADLLNRPIVIGLQVIPPIVMSLVPALGAHFVTWGIVAVVAVMWICAYMFKWWVPSRPIKTYDRK